ncbi:integrin alpha-PS4-like [Epargyreus clarus]|uniref:integrin alpha-PS4-like n=1 Tax=Epargyreus clarus TaxID=520877 RepID=UPI003C2FFCD3
MCLVQLKLYSRNLIIMYGVFMLCLVCVSCVMCYDDLKIFHEPTKLSLHPDKSADYFGYSVLLYDEFLVVGAPKARSRVHKSMSPGLLFTCPLNNFLVNHVTCTPEEVDGGLSTIDDMWFGAGFAKIFDGELLTCAPRWSTPHETYLLMFGGCRTTVRSKTRWLWPLRDGGRLSYKTDGKRKDYLDYGLSQPYFSYGQAGMSVKVTEANTIIMGAPSLLQWAGGISEFTLYPEYYDVSYNSTTTNLYNTLDVRPNDYFGYSVESGVFDASKTVLYVAGAPRSYGGYGQVFIFRQPANEDDPLDIKAKVHGPHLGSYFGASVCCVDVNGDGVVDLLVGAPNYVEDDELAYDQGAVFVFLTERQGTTFVLQDTGYLSGSQGSGANFGRTIAELGDIDGDGYTDVAIGAPWEADGRGAVYIYRGGSTGLRGMYAQRITVQDAKGFGISISRGLDVNKDNCKDLAVGAYESASAYVFRCIPTMQVFTDIKVDTSNLQLKTPNLTAVFCVTAPPKEMWPSVSIHLSAKITIDPERRRARLLGDSEYRIFIQPDMKICNDRTIEIVSHEDLLKPIPITFALTVNHDMKDDSLIFKKWEARLSKDSVLHSSLNIQILKDCGEDLICKPLLDMSLKPLVSPFVPGLDDRLGFTVTLINKEEPTYGAKVYVQLPSTPTKVPDACNFEGRNVTCKVPSTLYGGKSVSWDFEMEYTYEATFDKELKVMARLEILSAKDEIESKIKELKIVISPQANFSISSFRTPNNTILVSRDIFNAAGSVNYSHLFMVHLSGFTPIDGCVGNYSMNCTWSLRAKESRQIILPLSFNLKEYGDILEENGTLHFTSTFMFLLEGKQQNLSITTTLVLEPAPPLWPLIVGCLAGIILLAAIVFMLHKCGFFTRSTRDKLKKMQEQPASPEESGPSPGTASNCDHKDNQSLLADSSIEQ